MPWSAQTSLCATLAVAAATACYVSLRGGESTGPTAAEDGPPAVPSRAHMPPAPQRLHALPRLRSLEAGEGGRRTSFFDDWERKVKTPSAGSPLPSVPFTIFTLLPGIRAMY